MNTNLKTLGLALSCTLLGMANTAQADTGMQGGYFGASYSLISYTEDGLTDTFNPSVLMFRIGKDINPNFAVEGRLGFGLASGSHSYNVSGTPLDLDLKIDSMYGFYGVGKLPISDRGYVYGLIGYTGASATATAKIPTDSASASSDESDISYGVGVSVGVSDKISIDAEYISYMSKSDFDASAFAIGVSSRF